jgi:tRNA(Ile)-lysidine synthase
MIKKIFEFMEKNNMLAGCENVVVGLSGGADSVCLLNVLKRIASKPDKRLAETPSAENCKCVENPVNFRIVAVHINHGIRGEEADRDESFARSVAEGLGVEFRAFKLDIPGKALAEGISEETAGRIARYQCFREVARELGEERTKIAVAHHMDDQAETVLMHMIRGSSVTGLAGMRAVSGSIIRPLLCVSRREIEQFLADNGITYVTDSTNSDNSYTRNAVRNTIIPEIQKINSRFNNCINGMAADVARYEDFVARMTDVAEREYLKVSADDKAGEYAARECVLEDEAEAERKPARALISTKAHETNVDELILANLVKRAYSAVHGDVVNLYRVHIEETLKLFSMDCGKRTDLPGNIVAERRADGVLLYDGERQASQTVAAKNELQSDGEIKLNFAVDGEIKFKFNFYNGISGLEWEIIENKDLINFINNDYTKYFDYDMINVEPVVRLRRAGDVCVIDQAGHEKKLKQELIDRKVPSSERDSVLLMASGEHVLWAVGVRRYEEFLMTEGTKRVLKVTALGG